MEMSSPSSLLGSPFNKTRARKPNFTNDEIDCLLELVTQNRDVLLRNDYKADSMRQKQLIWQQIADDVTLNGDRLCQRDASDVRQKWKDLLRWANKDMITLKNAKENDQKTPTINPYSTRVIEIKKGTHLYGEDGTESNIFSSPTQVHNRNHRMKIKQEIDMEEGDCDGNIPSSSGWQPHNDRTIKPTDCEPKFTSSEIKCLISLYDHNKSNLKSDNSNMTEKSTTWKTIAKAVSEIGNKRTAIECLQKWQKFLLQAKKEETMENEEAEKGGSFPKSPFTDLILKVDRTEEQVINEEGIADEFWDSIEDNTGDINLSNEDKTALMEYINGEDDLLRSLSDEDGSAEVNDDSAVTMNETTNGQREGGEPSHSYSTRAATSVQSRPLKMTLSSPKPTRTDFPRKRKRPLSSFINSSRLTALHSTRPHHNSASTNGVPLNHFKERQDFESRRCRLEIEKLELENALMRSQQEKMELEKDKLRLEMAKLEQEKEKIAMEKEVAATNVKLLRKQLMGFD